MHKFAVVPLALACCLPVVAAEKFSVEARVKAITPYVDEQMLAIAHVDLSRLDAEVLIARVIQLGQFSPERAADFKKTVQEFLGPFRQAGAKELYVFFSLADMPQSSPFVIVPLEGKAEAQAIIKILKGDDSAGRPSPFASETVEKLGNAVFAGGKETRKRLAALKPAPCPELVKALAAAGDTMAQFVVLPSADTRRALKDSLPTLPREIGGGPITIFTDGVRWGALGVDPPPRMKVHVFIQSRDDQAAQQLEKWIAGFWKRVGQEKGAREALPNFDDLTRHLTPAAQGDHLTLDAAEKDLTTFLAPVARKLQFSAAHARSVNNLKQIGLALHNYHDSLGHFPTAAIYSKDGKPLLSWRVAILPYVEQDHLFKQFKLDEPWDSAHNKKLIAKMPAIYQAQPGVAAGKTLYLGVAGASAMFPPGPKPITIRDVTDGTSNTIFVVEAAANRAVVWTRPEDYNYDPAKPLAGLGGAEGRFTTLFADGSVRFISNKIDPKTLTGLFTRNGGEATGEIP